MSKSHQRTNRSLLQRLQNQQTLNFWLTNRVPRGVLTRLMGRFSRIRSRRMTALAIRIWRLFADDLRLHEAERREFDSLRDCFIRRLKPGVRPVDRRPRVLTSPCDAEIGALGRIEGDSALQAKGMVYRLSELVRDPTLAASHRGGWFVTLRLKSSMYHRFHAPCAGRLRWVRYIAGEVYNVNPPALARIPRLFCVNERAVLPLRSDLGRITLVPVAAILVASMRIHALPATLNTRSSGPDRIECDARFEKGDELGFFEHGSTMIVLTGPGFELSEGIESGRIIRMGQPLLRGIRQRR
ncbi:MAG: archaetidylserine decarboxylase [Wenzhouxiangellaceae bacterium]